jgi:hypothetical protein
MRRATALPLLAPAALALALASAASGGAAVDRPVLLAASPAHEPSDVAGGGYLRVTFSPDGDGRDDAVRIRVRATPGEELALRLNPASRPATLLPLPTARGTVTTVVWRGLQENGVRYPTGSYVLRVCDLTTRLCAGEAVLAHLRVISVYARTAVGVSAGASVRVHVATDRPGPVTLDLVRADDLAGAGIGAVTVAPGSRSYRIPAVPSGGLWMLRARSGDAVTHFPLVVHDPSLPLDDPPLHTVLVVYPYLTWRAYDQFDENRDGQVDSWYAHPTHPVVPLYGPFEPPTTDPLAEGLEANPESMAAFEGWMTEHGLVAQHVTDVELGRMPASLLRRYAEVVFAGHTEYYELGTYGKVLHYRDAGGHLYFMQGNSFYGRAQIVGTSVWRRSYRYRTPSRSDFALAVTGFRSCCWPRTVRPLYRLADGAVAALSWAFAGTGLKDGDPFGVAAGEVDTVDRTLSPRGTVTVATATVPAFTPRSEKEANAWIGSKPIPYEPAWKRTQTIVVAFARVGRGEVFNWADTGFMKTVRNPGYGLAAGRRTALDRVALNVWEYLAR